MALDRRESPRISAIVLALNESERIGACLRSLKTCVDEVYVVDSGSTDGTIEIAQELGAQVVSRPFVDYADQRNWAQDHLPIANDWVLHLDADETLDDELAVWIRDKTPELVAGDDETCVLIRRVVRFLDREMKHGGIYPTYHCRLFRRTAGRCETRFYDQHFVCSGVAIRAPGAMIEDNGTDVVAWCRKHLTWAQLEARELGASATEVAAASAVRLHGRFAGDARERRRWLRERAYGRSPKVWRAWAYLVYRLIFRLGFLDGWRGVVYHSLHGFWFRLVVDSILMSEERLKGYPDAGS